MKLALLLCAVALPAKADETRERVMGKIADVIAIQQLCPELKPNFSIVQVGILAFKIDMAEGTPDYLWLQRKTREQINALRAHGGHDMACLTGNTLYGPGGLNGPNMMVPR